MRVAVRADSGTEMGVGHIMRCLTLLDQLAGRLENLEALFVCREHLGHLAALIEARGYPVALLKVNTEIAFSNSLPEHERWLAETSTVDVKQTSNSILERWGGKVDWLIVDHYGVDQIWERQLGDVAERVMVIDDLANRPHDCDLLLDQTYGETEIRYQELVPTRTRVLVGAAYVLLRKEFNLDLEALKSDRRGRDPRNLLISLGGGDPENITGQIIDALRGWRDRFDRITVIAGHANPYVDRLQAQTDDMDVTLLTGVSNIAELMCEHDLAVGASGSTSWERCALGLPTVAVVTANNQLTIINNLQSACAVKSLNPPYSRAALEACMASWLDDRSSYQRAVDACFGICDGKGVDRVCDEVLSL